MIIDLFVKFVRASLAGIGQQGREPITWTDLALQVFCVFFIYEYIGGREGALALLLCIYGVLAFTFYLQQRREHRRQEAS